MPDAEMRFQLQQHLCWREMNQTGQVFPLGSREVLLLLEPALQFVDLRLQRFRHNKKPFFLFFLLFISVQTDCLLVDVHGTLRNVASFTSRNFDFLLN